MIEKHNDEWTPFDGPEMTRDQHIACSTEILMSMFRRKITACGYDISFENMADLKSGIEGELKDLIQTAFTPADRS